MAIASVNPATGKVFKTFDELSDQELEGKLALASEAFAKHRATSFAYRAERMLKAAGAPNTGRTVAGSLEHHQAPLVAFTSELRPGYSANPSG